MPTQTLILGLGNILLQDEGLGVDAVQRLRTRYRLPAEAEALDGGTLGLDLLPLVEDAEALLIVDAVQTGQPPGTLVRLEGEAIPAALAVKMSMHQFGLGELLAVGALRGTLPPRIVLWGLEPASFKWGVGLSPAIEAQIDKLVEGVVQELRSWGMELADA